MGDETVSRVILVVVALHTLILETKRDFIACEANDEGRVTDIGGDEMRLNIL